MRWENLLFLHWAWSPSAIQATLPAGLTVDTFQDRAWVAVVPFAMRAVHPIGLFPLPWLSDFLELNVRTYVKGPNGQTGVWFYSLACNQPLAVEIARRTFNLNYVHASMAIDVADRVNYSCRRGSTYAKFSYPSTLKGCRPAEPGSLEEFLVERYVLFSCDRRGRLHAGRVHHEPYLIAAAPSAAGCFTPAVLDGFTDPGRSHDHALIAKSVTVEAWPIRQCGMA